MDFDELLSVYRRWLHLDHDPEIVRLIYAVMLANRYDGNPVWAMVLGPSGCGKTQLLTSLGAYDNVALISNLTPYALASAADPSESLLFKLDGKILIVEDLSSVSEMPPDQRSLLFSFFRASYNGEFTRVTGKGTVSWKGKYGMLAGSTLAIEQSRKMESSLGERFLYIRMRVPQKDRITIMRATRAHAASSGVMKRELQASAARYLEDLKVNSEGRSLPISLVEKIEQASELLSVARSVVLRDQFTKEILFPAEVGELGTRLHTQLILVALAARAMGTPDEALDKIIYRLTLDSIPYIRLKLLEAVMNGAVRLREITRYMKMTGTVVQRHLEDLVQLEILDTSQSKEYVIVNPFVEKAFEESS